LKIASVRRRIKKITDADFVNVEFDMLILRLPQFVRDIMRPKFMIEVVGGIGDIPFLSPAQV